MYFNNESDSDKAELFNSYFHGNFNKNSYQLPEIREFVNDNLCNLVVYKQDVMDLMCNLDIKKHMALMAYPVLCTKIVALIWQPL